MCTAVINAKFNPKSHKILDLSGGQAVVLLAFNEVQEEEDKSLSIEKLLDMTGFEFEELAKQVLSLSMAEHQIL